MFILSDRTYDLLKRFVLRGLPAISSLYFGMAQIWGLPNAEQVMGTLALLATFLGICIGISHREYEKSGAAYDGKVVIETTETGGKLVSLDFEDTDPHEVLEKKDSVTFKVEPESKPKAKPKRKPKEKLPE